MSRRLALPLAVAAAAGAFVFGIVALATEDDPKPAPATEPAGGRELFARMGCGSCHRLAAAGSEGQIGPDLDAALGSHTRESLESKILTPGPDSAMPRDFGERMSAAELEALVGFLLATADRR